MLTQLHKHITLVTLLLFVSLSALIYNIDPSNLELMSYLHLILAAISLHNVIINKDFIGIFLIMGIIISYSTGVSRYLILGELFTVWQVEPNFLSHSQTIAIINFILLLVSITHSFNGNYKQRYIYKRSARPKRQENLSTLFIFSVVIGFVAALYISYLRLNIILSSGYSSIYLYENQPPLIMKFLSKFYEYGIIFILTLDLVGKKKINRYFYFLIICGFVFSILEGRRVEIMAYIVLIILKQTQHLVYGRHTSFWALYSYLLKATVLALVVAALAYSVKFPLVGQEGIFFVFDKLVLSLGVVWSVAAAFIDRYSETANITIYPGLLKLPFEIIIGNYRELASQGVFFDKMDYFSFQLSSMKFFDGFGVGGIGPVTNYSDSMILGFLIYTSELYLMRKLITKLTYSDNIINIGLAVKLLCFLPLYYRSSLASALVASIEAFIFITILFYLHKSKFK